MYRWVRMSFVWVSVCVVCAGLLGCPQDNRITVPNCVGVTQTLAEATIRAAGLTVGTVSEVYSDTVAAGKVIGQAPASGARVDPGTAVDLSISKGSSTVSVPEVVGMTQTNAESAITGLGLNVGTVAQANHVSVPAGSVIGQDPAAGTSVMVGTPVDLVISLGPVMVTVPDVVRNEQADAEAAILAAGLTVGTITPVPSDLIAAGFVISQNPAAAENAPSGSAVNLVVASGLVTAEAVPLGMVDVAGGAFEMGNDSAGEARHSVTLSAYSIGALEVTNMEYAAVLNWAYGMGYLTNGTGSPYEGDDIHAEGQFLVDFDVITCRLQFEGGAFSPEVTSGFTRALHPMTHVSWYGAVMFCNWLSEWAGFTPAYNTTAWDLIDTEPGTDGIQFTDGYRLPTEAEWEYAAAWDGATRYLYGFASDTLSASRANYGDANPLGVLGEPYTTLAGHYNGVSAGTIDSPSPVGCYDMTGNVKEWCHDWRTNYPDAPVTNPTGPTGMQTYKVMRGGHWSLSPTSDYLTTTQRDANYVGTVSSQVGFRVARTPAIK
ncbi:MAG: SUMF1/EgtB/PvdO family nonheme iron enzyme [Nitrospiraceae bacterium]|nr:SUMF1/EgtB/PvdO family nonheme iron enzyme [Nitrospiraceae bacterium]